MKKLKTEKISINFDDYLPSDDVLFDGDDEEELLESVKTVLFRDLNKTDRSVILHYAESRSQKVTAKALGISTSLCGSIVRRIRNNIKDLTEKELKERRK